MANKADHCWVALAGRVQNHQGVGVQRKRPSQGNNVLFVVVAAVVVLFTDKAGYEETSVVTMVVVAWVLTIVQALIALFCKEVADPWNLDAYPEKKAVSLLI